MNSEIDYTPFVRNGYYKKSITDLQSDIKNNDKFAAYELASRLKQQNKEDEAFKYYKLAADLGDKDALLEVAKLADKKNRIKEAFTYFEMAVEKTNCAEAHFKLGSYYYEKKIGNLFNRKRNMFKHFLAAAEQGYPRAQYILALLYGDKGGAESVHKYTFWLRCAQLNGEPAAISFLNKVMNESESLHQAWSNSFKQIDKEIEKHPKYIEEYLRNRARMMK